MVLSFYGIPAWALWYFPSCDIPSTTRESARCKRSRTVAYAPGASIFSDSPPTFSDSRYRTKKRLSSMSVISQTSKVFSCDLRFCGHYTTRTVASCGVVRVGLSDQGEARNTPHNEHRVVWA